jgi:hypothetical protein
MKPPVGSPLGSELGSLLLALVASPVVVGFSPEPVSVGPGPGPLVALEDDDAPSLVSSVALAVVVSAGVFSPQATVSSPIEAIQGKPNKRMNRSLRPDRNKIHGAPLAR